MIQVVPLRPPNREVVALLENLLRQARAGELIGLIYSAEVAGGQVQTGYTPIENIYEQIGQLERMKALLLRNLDALMQEMDASE